MSDDRQDFLERKEARQRRQQRRQSAPLPRQSNAAAPPTKPRQKAARPDSKKQPLPDDSLVGLAEHSPAGHPAGRRAARQAKQTRVAPLPAGPKPPLLSRLIIWGTVAICGMLMLATLGEAWTVYRLNQQIAANQQAAAQLQAQNQQLSSSIQQLQQPSTVEQEARKLGFIFPGDQPVVVVTTPPTAAPTPRVAPPAPGWWGFWPDWLKLFFGG